MPLLKDFLNAADAMRTSALINRADQELFDLVFTARDALTAVHVKSRLDFDNFEEIYSAFDMATLIGRLGDVGKEDVRRLPMAMRRLITVTIERSMKLPVSGNMESRKAIPPLPYDGFIKGILPLIREREATFITFNYDLALDYALHYNGIQFNYGLNDSGGLDLLKLHGSLNWGRCSSSSCRKIVVWALGDYCKQFSWGDMIDSGSVSLNLASNLRGRQHCHPETLEEDPVLIPPTWNKGGFHQELSSVWGKAAAHLAAAENIYVIGYSFPASDQFFKYFFAVGSVGKGWIQKIRVVDPDPTDEVKDRFSRIFGPNALSKFSLKRAKFEDVAGDIVKGLS